MFELLDIAPPALPVVYGYLMLGLINGSLYAILSLGLCIAFGMLDVVNFAHGTMYMLGAFISWMLLNYAGIGYWGAIVLAPVCVGLIGMVIERTMLRRLYDLHHVFALLLTFGLALSIEGGMRIGFNASGRPYNIPGTFTGAINLGFMYLPVYRIWLIGFSIVICVATWALIERTRLGSYLRASIENPALVETFGVNVPLIKTLTFGFAAALAALGGVLAAPIMPVSPQMGQSIIIIVFAVTVIGGLGSIGGAIIGGYLLAMVEALTKVFYPQASTVSIFVIMMLVLLFTQSGLGKRTA